MSSWLAGIVGMCVGSALGILMISIVSVTRKVEQENVIYKEGYTAGYKMGYTAGDRDGYRSGIKRMSAFGRVDVSPGPDSIRPEKWAENEKKEAAHD